MHAGAGSFIISRIFPGLFTLFLGGVVLALVLALIYAWPYAALWVLIGVGLVAAGVYKLRRPGSFSAAWGWVGLVVGGGLLIAASGWLLGAYDLKQAIELGLGRTGKEGFLNFTRLLAVVAVTSWIGLSIWQFRRGAWVSVLGNILMLLAGLVFWGPFVVTGQPLSGVNTLPLGALGMGLSALGIIVHAYAFVKATRNAEVQDTRRLGPHDATQDPSKS